jgi:hypothetical protein
MTSPRDRFRTTLETLAAQAKANLPENAGRIDAAVALVLAGDVVLQPDGMALVGSASQPMTTYSVNGTCACPDFARAPQAWCKHRIARALQLRTERTLQGAEASSSSQDAPSPGQALTPTPEDEDPAWSSLAQSRNEIPASEPHVNAEKAGRTQNACGKRRPQPSTQMCAL